MDATVYQIIFRELGDLNCSLIDALQDTFWGNASLSFLSSDGKMEFLFFPSPFFLFFFFFSCSIVSDAAVSENGNYKRPVLSPKGLYCNATSDEIGTCWPQSSTGMTVERPCPEYINGVKYNTTSKT